MGIEKYHFSRNTSPREREFHARILLTRADRIRVRDAPRFTAETHPYSKDIEFVINFVVRQLEQWFNLVLDPRTPQLQDILIFTQDGFKAILQKYSVPSNSSAFCLRQPRLIYLNCDQHKDEFFHEFIHELVHMLSETKTMIRHEGRGPLVVEATSITDHQSGFCIGDKNKFVALNEATTELLTCELMNALARSEGLKYNFMGDVVVYWKEIVCLVTFLQELSRRLGMSFFDFRQELFRAYFNGDISFLRVVKDHFGVETLKELADLSLVSNNAQVKFLMNNKVSTAQYGQLAHKQVLIWDIFWHLHERALF